MGTAYRLTVDGLAEADSGAIAASVRRAIGRVDSLMSTYRQESEISAFNRLPAHNPLQLSPETFEVLEAASQAGDLTEGAFDVTVAALVDAWGFGPLPVDDPPGPETIQRLRLACGWDKLELEPRARTVTKLHPEVRVDLSGIAKGFAVDLVANLLESAGHPAHLVDIGGEIRAGVRRASGERWKIGVERPQASGRGVHRILALSDTAIATSGNYRNFRERDGARYGHILDPRTGEPAESDVLSASVLDSSAMRADAVATAMLVLGSQAGMALAEREGLAVLLVVHDGSGGWTDLESTAFRARMGAGTR